MPVSTDNCILAWPNWLSADAAFAAVALSGGGFEPDAALDRLLTARLSDVTRTTDVSLSSCRFWVHLGASRRVKLLAFPWIRGRTFAGDLSGYINLMVRARLFTTQDETATPVWDTGWIDQHPVIYPSGTLPSTHPSFITGKITPEDASAFAWRQPWWSWIEDEAVASWILVEIDAAASGLACLELPHFIAAPGWQPTINMGPGTSLTPEPLTDVAAADSGAEFFDVRGTRRVMRFTLDMLPDDEAHAQALEAMLRLGIHTPVFFVFRPSDTVHKQRRAFLGRLRRLNALEYPLQAFRRNSVAFEISEILE